MFTSRAEFRLQLREDNADARLTEQGRALGLIDDKRWNVFNRKRDAVSRETERLKSTWVNPKLVAADESARVLGKSMEHEYSLGDLLRRPNIHYAALMDMALVDGGTAAQLSPRNKSGAGQGAAEDVDSTANVSHETSAPTALAPEVVEQIEIAFKYSGYIERQKEEIERAAHYENMALPADFDYMSIDALSIEVRQKLAKYKPPTLGLASRISGVTPAAVSLLLVYLKKHKSSRA